MLETGSYKPVQLVPFKILIHFVEYVRRQVHGEIGSDSFEANFELLRPVLMSACGGEKRCGKRVWNNFIHSFKYLFLFVYIRKLVGGGGGGIRTHGGREPTPVFKTGAFDHSATPPGGTLSTVGKTILKDVVLREIPPKKVCGLFLIGPRR